MRKTTKKLAWCAAVLLAALALAACGARNTGEQGSPADAPAAVSEEAQTDEFRVGTYNGLADGHTVEIGTENGAQAYQISHEIFKKVKSWEPGVKVKYKAEDLKITEIELEQVQ